MISYIIQRVTEHITLQKQSTNPMACSSSTELTPQLLPHSTRTKAGGKPQKQLEKAP